MSFQQNILTTILYFSLVFCLNAQDSITGNLTNYSGDNSEIITGFMNPTKVGEIQQNGSFELVLPENYAAELLTAVENQDNSGGFTMRLRVVDDAFGNCSDGTIAIENGDQPVVNLTTQNSFMVGNMEEQKQYGYLVVSNSRKFASALMSYEHGTDKKGYFIDWYYFDEPASVKGECSIKSYTLTQTEDDAYTSTTTYDLNFKKGWNIVKYEYETIHTDSENKTYANTIRYETLTKMPKEAEFIYFEK